MVGVLRWAVELGRFDIVPEAALMSTYLALTHMGNIEQIFHVFGYLNLNSKRNIFFDTQHP